MIIDLCCGLGLSEWLEDDVVGIDIDPSVRPTIVADIRYLPLRKGIKPKIAHASPPCKYFSLARSLRTGYNEEGLAESFRLVAACFDAFAWLEPEMWTLENPYYGFLRKIIPTDLMLRYGAYDIPAKTTSLWSNKRALKRAIIPKDVKQRIISAVS